MPGFMKTLVTRLLNSTRPYKGRMPVRETNPVPYETIEEVSGRLSRATHKPRPRRWAWASNLALGNLVRSTATRQTCDDSAHTYTRRVRPLTLPRTAGVWCNQPL
jgi:hypothetical protein